MSVDHDSAHDAEPKCGNPVVALVVGARNGDERAWAALVERYAPLIWSLSAASGRTAAGAWTSCATTRPSPR
jgi:hypothetical protein